MSNVGFAAAAVGILAIVGPSHPGMAAENSVNSTSNDKPKVISSFDDIFQICVFETLGKMGERGTMTTASVKNYSETIEAANGEIFNASYNSKTQVLTIAVDVHLADEKIQVMAKPKLPEVLVTDTDGSYLSIGGQVSQADVNAAVRGAEKIESDLRKCVAVRYNLPKGAYNQVLGF